MRLIQYYKCDYVTSSRKICQKLYLKGRLIGCFGCLYSIREITWEWLEPEEFFDAYYFSHKKMIVFYSSVLEELVYFYLKKFFFLNLTVPFMDPLGLLVMSGFGFKARIDPLTCVRCHLHTVDS